MKAELLCIMLLAAAALPLAAQTPQGQQARSARAERRAQALNLTEPQKASIKAIHQKRRPDRLVRRDSLKQARLAFRTARQDANTPEAQLRTLHDKASAAQFDLMLARRAEHQEVLTVLTPEQRAKAIEMQIRIQARMRERKHHLRQAAGLAG